MFVWLLLGFCRQLGRFDTTLIQVTFKIMSFTSPQVDLRERPRESDFPCCANKLLTKLIRYLDNTFELASIKQLMDKMFLDTQNNHK